MKKRIDTFWRYRNLLFELVKKGIKLKYRRSYLGIIWSLLEPVMTGLKEKPVSSPESGIRF